VRCSCQGVTEHRVRTVRLSAVRGAVRTGRCVLTHRTPPVSCTLPTLPGGGRHASTIRGKRTSFVETARRTVHFTTRFPLEASGGSGEVPHPFPTHPCHGSSVRNTERAPQPSSLHSVARNNRVTQCQCSQTAH